MKNALILAAGLALGSMAMAQDNDRERAEALTGTRILDPQLIVFSTIPVRLEQTLSTLAGALPIAAKATPERPSITFVLDDDLGVAAEVFRKHPGFSTDQVITDIHSLAGVHDYLVQASGAAFGIINLVAHGSPQTGLDVAIEHGGARASAGQLARYQADSSVLAGKVDANTQIRVYSCGVGADPDLLDGLARFFQAGDKVKPQLAGLSEFIAFSDNPAPSVALLDALTVIAPTRMKARQAIERLAANQGRDLPFGWHRDFDTKPLEIELMVQDTGQDPALLAAISPAIASELDRLNTRPADFRWAIEGHLLTGTALVGYLPVGPGKRGAVLESAGQARWITY